VKGSELRRLREERAVTTRTLGKAIGVTGATVSRWETGSRRIHPAFERLLRLYFRGGLPQESSRSSLGRRRSQDRSGHRLEHERRKGDGKAR